MYKTHRKNGSYTKRYQQAGEVYLINFGGYAKKK